MTDALLIDAALLLFYRPLSVKAYAAVGVESGFIRRAPYFSWLPQCLEMELEDASAVQVTCDQKLTDLLFDFKNKPWEQPALDLAHLFSEAGHTVHVYSHESPDALDAILARAGMPASVERYPLVSVDRRYEVVASILDTKDTNWLAVYDWGLPRSQERSIVAALAGRGVLVNVKEPTQRSADDALLRVVEERWLK